MKLLTCRGVLVEGSAYGSPSALLSPWPMALRRRLTRPMLCLAIPWWRGEHQRVKAHGLG